MDDYTADTIMGPFFSHLPKWQRTLKRQFLLYGALNTMYENVDMLSQVTQVMQKHHPGDYVLTYDNKDVKVVFEDKNKETLWLLKNS